MNKIEIIERIAEGNRISEPDKKLFFEILLKRLSEVLKSDESLIVQGLGRFEYRKSPDENEMIVFVSNENDDFHFDIPPREEENLSIDSYFSISIGKPIIPLKTSEHEEFFVPVSGDEMKRMLELKVEQFIESSRKNQIEAEEQTTSDIADIRFSFLNWKRSSNLNEEINKIEKELDDSFIPGENESSNEEVNEIEQESFTEEAEKIKSQVNESDAGEIKEIHIAEGIIDELKDKEEIKEANEDFISEDLKVEDEIINEDELIESADEWVTDLVDDSENKEVEIEEVIEPPANYNEIIPSLDEEKEKIDTSGDMAISEAFKYAEEKKARIESYKKRTKGGFVFAAVIILVSAAVIYFSFYFNNREEIAVISPNAKSKVFKTVIERSFDIPVTYPYEPKMFAGIYDAIDKDILKPLPVSENIPEQKTDIAGNSNSKTPEIRASLPSKRIIGYIYQYDDGMFAVQVSSWKSKTIALSETRKLLDKSYNAFIEETGVSGKTYYRVRVGGFKSLNDAQKFSGK